jgi:very-short-patch-repair endonuclease
MPARRTTPEGYKRARELRRALTPAEKKLWMYLKDEKLGARFRRQYALGPYIPDFCSPKARLIIELDGSQHVDQAAYDTERTAFFESKGYRVLRFWNHDVMNNIEAVLRVIEHALGTGVSP